MVSLTYSVNPPRWLAGRRKEENFMVEALNTKVEVVEKGTYFTTFSAYGKVLVGD